MTRFVLFTACAVLALVLAAPAPARADAKFALIVQGVSGDPTYAEQHRQWVDDLVGVLRDRYGYDADHLVVLTEKPGAGETRSTADGVRTALAGLAKAMTADDQLVVIMIGHGSGQGADVKFNLIGPDLGVAEWATLLEPIPGRLVVVDTTSASHPYLAGLAGTGRVVITATSAAAQRYHTVFPDGFVRAFTEEGADLDKNGRISLLEAFTYASDLVKQHYEQNGTMATETAMIDDDGDGQGRTAAATGPDGEVAALTYLDTPAVPTSSDPEVQRLLVRQQSLTDEIDDLRRRRTTMPAEAFDRELERLLLELAVVSRDVRQRTGGAE